MIARTISFALLLGLGVAATPAEAQKRQKYVEVFGDDVCPEGENDEIVVCGRKPESDRFRIPTELREASPTDRQSQEARVDEMVAIGRTGTGSCSSVGPGGFTGCQHQTNRAWLNEKRKADKARRDAVVK